MAPARGGVEGGEEDVPRSSLSLGQGSPETRAMPCCAVLGHSLARFPERPPPKGRDIGSQHSAPEGVKRPGPGLGTWVQATFPTAGLRSTCPLVPRVPRPWPRCPETCISCTGSTAGAARRNSTSCPSCRWQGSRWHTSTPETSRWGWGGLWKFPREGQERAGKGEQDRRGPGRQRMA